jgi:hypothetical protein
MTPDGLLSVLVVILVPFSWVSAVVLAHAAYQRPRIGALTERAVVAVAIAVMVTAGGLLTVNRTSDHSLFPVDIARIVFSLAVIAVGSVPLAWTYLWFRGRLGEDGE